MIQQLQMRNAESGNDNIKQANITTAPTINKSTEHIISMYNRYLANLEFLFCLLIANENNLFLQEICFNSGNAEF